MTKSVRFQQTTVFFTVLCPFSYMEVLWTCALSRVGFPKQRETVGPDERTGSSSGPTQPSGPSALWRPVSSTTQHSHWKITVCYHNAPDGTAAVRQPNPIKGAHVILKVKIKTWNVFGLSEQNPKRDRVCWNENIHLCDFGFYKNDYVEFEVDMGHKMYQITIYLLFKYADWASVESVVTFANKN